MFCLAHQCSLQPDPAKYLWSSLPTTLLQKCVIQYLFFKSYFKKVLMIQMDISSETVKHKLVYIT